MACITTYYCGSIAKTIIPIQQRGEKYIVDATKKHTCAQISRGNTKWLLCYTGVSETYFSSKKTCFHRVRWLGETSQGPRVRAENNDVTHMLVLTVGIETVSGNSNYEMRHCQGILIMTSLAWSCSLWELRHSQGTPIMTSLTYSRSPWELRHSQWTPIMTSLIAFRTETLSGNPYYDVTHSFENWDTLREPPLWRHVFSLGTEKILSQELTLWRHSHACVLCSEYLIIMCQKSIRVTCFWGADHFQKLSIPRRWRGRRDEMTFTNISLLFVARQNIFDPFVSIHLNEYRKTELARSHDYIITWRTQAIMHRFLSPKALKLKILSVSYWIFPKYNEKFTRALV